MKGKGKQRAQSPLQSDEEGFFSSSGTVSPTVNPTNTSSQLQTQSQALVDGQSPSQAYNNRIQHKTSLLFSGNPLPPLSEKSANSDLDDVLSSTSENVSDSDASAMNGVRPTRRRDSLRIELPPPPAQFKDAYPAILVDSTHASDSEASGTTNGIQRRRRRRSTASASNRLGADSETVDDDDDEDFADDNSSWPSTPSTTPLDVYFTAADAKPKAARNAMQTTKEIIAPSPGALGMGRPMVVVTSPSTASEVSSDRRSSSGSGSTPDRVATSSPPPAAMAAAAAPALSKIEEHSDPKVDAEAGSAGPPRRSLSFEIPAVPRRPSEENISSAAQGRLPSRTMAFFAKMNPSKSSNRSSVDLADSARTEASSASVEATKRMSLDNQQRTSTEQRRSVELRPILLNAASRPAPRPVSLDHAMAGPTAVTTATAEQKHERRRSSGRVPIRGNVVPYHSRRSSEVSAGSSIDSPKLQDLVSFDKHGSDPHYSPESQATALTMPSPALSTKPFLPQNRSGGPSSNGPSDRRPTAIGPSKDRFAASEPSLHQPVAGERPSDRRSPSHEEASGPPSAIRLLVDSQKGRTARDNDSIAEWISVSVNDLPLKDFTHPYGNGGAGEFSNENQQLGKKPKKNKPWKLGRFAASEVVLPTTASAQQKRRSISLVKRASSAQVDNVARASADSTSSVQKEPLLGMRNLGFTTANRNVVLQKLYAERSISALAASSIYIAGCGRINVPEPRSLPVDKVKAKVQQKAYKKQNQRPGKQVTIAATEAPSNPSSPSQGVEASRDAYLNLSEDRRTGYDLTGAAMGTVKSMVPELGDWSGSSAYDNGPGDDHVVERPFRDYEDEGSDLFDSDPSESESESEEELMDQDDEDFEVPVRFGQRFSVASRAGIQTKVQSSTKMAAANSKEVEDKKVSASPSLERLSPGTVVCHGAELRACVDDDASTLAYWKAVTVQQAKNSSDDSDQCSQQAGAQVRRQPSSKAMKLEQEVATGIFAAFVGNRGPRRQKPSTDPTSTGNASSKDGGSPQKCGDGSSMVASKELLISKLNQGNFYVRSTDAADGQVIEIITRSGSGLSREPSIAGAPVDKLARAFPSPLLSNADLTHLRSRSNRTSDSQVSLELAGSERIKIRIQRNGGRGFVASLKATNGEQWSWQGSKLEASILSNSRAHTDGEKHDVLDGYDMSLRASVGQDTIELATYSTNSEVRNALGLFKPRTKSMPKPLPDDESRIGAPIPPPAQVLPLGALPRGLAGPMGRGQPQIPRRGIRGGPLLGPQPIAAGSAVRYHGVWQNQRGAMSSEAVVQVHNNAVNNARASLLLNDRVGSASTNAYDSKALGTASKNTPRTIANKKMGEITFSSVEALDRDLAVLSLLAVLGVAKV